MAGTEAGEPAFGPERFSVNSAIFFFFFFCRHRGTTEGSAICVFTMKDVQRAFSGLYKEVNRETQQWYTVTYPVPTPRPGAVRTAPCTRVGCWAGGPRLPPRLQPPSFSKAVFSS